MVFLELFLAFVKVGFSSFGGMSMIAVIYDEVTGHGWMTGGQVSDLVAIAEMTPGPMGLNCATFAGMQAAGFLGGLVAVLGVLTPALTLTLLAAVFFNRFRKSRVMEGILAVVKPICIGMIVGVMVTLCQENFFPTGGVDLMAVAVAVAAGYLLRKRKWSVPKVIVASAVMGIVGFGLL